MEGKIRNYILGHQELGLPLDRLRRHYVDGLNEDPQSPINADGRLTAEQFDALAADPVTYPARVSSCNVCKSQSQAYEGLTLEDMRHVNAVNQTAAAYVQAAAAASDGEPGLTALLETLRWPGVPIFLITTVTTYFGWRLDLD